MDILHLFKQLCPFAEAQNAFGTKFFKASLGLFERLFMVETGFREKFVGVANEFFFKRFGHVRFAVVVGQWEWKPLRNDFGAGDAGTGVALANP